MRCTGPCGPHLFEPLRNLAAAAAAAHGMRPCPAVVNAAGGHVPAGSGFRVATRPRLGRDDDVAALGAGPAGRFAATG